MALKFLPGIADIGRMTKYALKTMVLVAMLFNIHVTRLAREGGRG